MVKIIKVNPKIHVINTDKYKTITVKINFKKELIKEDITIRNLLINSLFLSTKKFNSKRLIDIECENLYGLAYRGYVFASGIYSILSLEITFLSDDYTDKNNSKKCLDFLAEVLFNPADFNINFKKAYNNIYDELISLKENTNMYSQIRMLECLNDPIISARSVGYLSDLEKITPDDLKKYYESVLKNDNVDIFVIGDIKKDFIDYLKDKFKFEKRIKLNKSNIYNPSFHNEKNIVKEDVNTSQSKLVMGFKLMNLTDYERRYVINIYNYILGGSPDSKLFKNVREANSLCYSITSTVYPLTSLLIIKSGIDQKNYDEALKLINKEIKDLNNGKFSKKDIDAGILTYINSLKELKDSASGMLSLKMSKYYNKSESISAKIKNIKKVTKEDIMNLSSKIKLDTIYFLRGNNND